MPKYRKKPVVIEAVQLTWQNWDAICSFVPRPWFVEGCYLDTNGKETQDANGRLGLKLQTLESQEFIARENDWIIKGVAGEFYPCKPDIFDQTYEMVGALDDPLKLIPAAFTGCSHDETCRNMAVMEALRVQLVEAAQQQYTAQAQLSTMKTFLDRIRAEPFWNAHWEMEWTLTAFTLAQQEVKP